MNDAVHSLHLSVTILYDYTHTSLTLIWNDLRNNADNAL